MESTEFDQAHRSDLVTSLLTVLIDDLDGLTERVVMAIRGEVTAYQDFPLDVHMKDNHVNLQNLLEGLVSFTVPNAQTIEHARFMGQQRALANLELAVATAGYYVAYGAVWQELLSLAEKTGDSQVKQELTGYVRPLWHWFREMNGAFATAYLQTQESMQVTRSDRRAIVHEAMRSGMGADRRSQEAAESLGFDAEGSFTVLFGSPIDPRHASELVGSLESVNGQVELLAPAPETVVVVQSADPAAVDQIACVMVDVGAVTGVGVGRAASGLERAADSYSEARRSFDCTSAERVIAEFEKVWPLTLLMSRSDLLEEMLTGGLIVAARNPHLAETVDAFAAQRYSLTRTARVLHLHPNTTKYRLTRWEELTGWDVFTLEGLTRSLICLEYARVGPGASCGTGVHS